MERAPRTEKVLAVSEIREKFEKSQACVLTNYRGIDVATMTRLRRNMRDAGIDYRVIKNTLAKLALSELGISGLDEHLEGPTAIAFGMMDPVAPAKVVTGFQKEAKQLEIKAGILGNRAITADAVKALADLPPRETLLARVAGCFASPMATFASLLSAPIRNVGYALQAIHDKKREEEAGALA